MKYSFFTIKNHIIFNAIIWLSIVCYGLSGCSVLKPLIESDPWKPFADCVTVTEPTKNIIYACNTSIAMLAKISKSSEDAGLITTDEKLRVLSRLHYAAVLLQKIRNMDELQNLEQVQLILVSIKNQLPEQAQ
jgi:hypothetical protein